MEPAGVFDLFLHFLMLAFMSIGGTNTVLPDMHRYAVDLHGFLTDQQFAEAFALAHAAPGPNVLYVTLIGWQAAGWPGAFATTLSLLIPPLTVTLLVVRLNTRNPDAPLGRAIRFGVAPISIGLTLASGLILVGTVAADWLGVALSALGLLLALRTKWSPLWLMAGGALVGLVAGLA